MNKKRTSRGRRGNASALALREFSKAVPMALLRAREAAIGYFRPALREFDLTEQQWRILRALSDGDEMEVLDLARATFLKATSLSRILPKLEKRGLCRRRRARNDLRRVLIELTPAGWKILNTLGPTYEAAYGEITRRFGKERLARFLQLAREFETALATEAIAGEA